MPVTRVGQHAIFKHQSHEARRNLNLRIAEVSPQIRKTPIADECQRCMDLNLASIRTLVTYPSDRSVLLDQAKNSRLLQCDSSERGGFLAQFLNKASVVKTAPGNIIRKSFQGIPHLGRSPILEKRIPENLLRVDPIYTIF
ncbi:hypothetical protein Mapa_004514 [Marchantia paleacea]|nr:hypothetical protein Mapa_004514 [Marchantia paleacea]